MPIRKEQLLSQVRPRTFAGKFVQFPLVRVFAVALFILPVMVLHNLAVDRLLSPLPPQYFRPLLDVELTINVVLFIVAYRFYTRVVERREAHEFGLGRSMLELGAGFTVSLAIVGVMVLLMSLLGYYTIDGFNSWTTLVHSLFRFGSGSFVQRLFFSVILFKLTEELLGSWGAMALVALLFGFAHAFNENATVWTSLSLVLSDGVLMAAGYMLTRRIWLVWGLHFGWNYAQDGIFGMPNSGITSLDSWIDPVIEGPALVTGGAWGIEASPLAIAANIVLGLVLLRLALDQKQVLAPLWSRGRQVEGA